MKYISTQTSFKSGRLSEKLTGRNDVPEYQNGLSIGKNGFVAKQGGAYKRFGIKNLTGLPTGWTDAQLKTYVVYEDKTVNLLMLDTGFMIFDEDGNPITQYTPWFGIFDPQQFDTALLENKIYVTHYSGLMKPIVIELVLLSPPVTTATRVSMGFTGALGTNNITSVPMKDFNTSTALQMRLLGVSGSTHILESSFPHFSLEMVGEFVMIKGISYIQRAFGQTPEATLVTGAYLITNYISPTQVDVTGLVTVDYGFGPPNGAGPYDVLTNWAFPDDSYTAPIAIDQTTGGAQVNSYWFPDWTQSAWNAREGWPKTVSVDEGRLIYGGTPLKPSTFYGSLIGDPSFFLDKRFAQELNGLGYSGDIEDSDPYQFTIASDDDSAITFMQATSSFIIGTLRREYIVSGGGQTVSKKNISVRPHTAHGSSPLQTAVYDSNVFYIGTSGKQLFLLRYTEENGSFISKEISVLFDDILEDGVTISQIN
jgi:hypothetical protein